MKSFCGEVIVGPGLELPGLRGEPAGWVGLGLRRVGSGGLGLEPQSLRGGIQGSSSGSGGTVYRVVVVEVVAVVAVVGYG